MTTFSQLKVGDTFYHESDETEVLVKIKGYYNGTTHSYHSCKNLEGAPCGYIRQDETVILADETVILADSRKDDKGSSRGFDDLEYITGSLYIEALGLRLKSG